MDWRSWYKTKRFSSSQWVNSLGTWTKDCPHCPESSTVLFTAPARGPQTNICYLKACINSKYSHFLEWIRRLAGPSHHNRYTFQDRLEETEDRTEYQGLGCYTFVTCNGLRGSELEWLAYPLSHPCAYRPWLFMVGKEMTIWLWKKIFPKVYLA